MGLPENVGLIERRRYEQLVAERRALVDAERSLTGKLAELDWMEREIDWLLQRLKRRSARGRFARN